MINKNRDPGEMYKKEIMSLQQLSSPHIIQLHDIIDTPTCIFLVQDILEIDLFEYISIEGKIQECTIRTIFSQLLSAIKHCNCCHIVHRDIKLENILVDTKTMNIQLCDFGLATVLRDGEFQYTKCG
jgi:serine/threonine protein kinase